MLQSYLEKILLDFCSFYGKSVEILGFENDKVPQLKVKGSSEVLTGFRNIVSAISNTKPKSIEDTTVHDQWIEYAATNAAFLQNSSNTSFILKELHDYMSDKVYFIGNKLSSADILMYLFIYDVMVTLTFQEKEKYLNISRWFDNVQQDKKLRSWRAPVFFSKTRLYA